VSLSSQYLTYHSLTKSQIPRCYPGSTSFGNTLQPIDQGSCCSTVHLRSGIRPLQHVGIRRYWYVPRLSVPLQMLHAEESHKGTYLGDYFGILMSNRVTGFPFNVLNDPMYIGSALSHLGTALWFQSPVGILLAAWVHVVYTIALKYEG
jgi:hypothetical protein